MNEDRTLSDHRLITVRYRLIFENDTTMTKAIRLMKNTNFHQISGECLQKIIKQGR